MEKGLISEEETIGKRSIRWQWPLAILVVVVMAFALSSKIGFFSEGGHDSLGYSHQLKNGHTRVSPPSTYTIKFENFPALMYRLKDGYHKSRPFTVGGYNWTFIVYPNGMGTFGQAVSVYVKIDESSLTTGAGPKEVHAEIKFFARYYFGNNYYYYQEPSPIMFSLLRLQWGVQLFLPTESLWNPARGYVTMGGESVLGVDVFIAPPLSKLETVSADGTVKTTTSISNGNLTK